MKATNAKIYAARIALAKIANVDLPLPLIAKIAPLLAKCESVIEKAMRNEAENGDEFERFMNGERELPACVLPILPEIRMSYVDYKSLEGIIQFEEVRECRKL